VVDARPPATQAGDELPLRIRLRDGSSFAGRVVTAAEGGFVAQIGANRTVRIELAALSSITGESRAASGVAKFESWRKSVDELMNRGAGEDAAAMLQPGEDQPTAGPPAEDIAVIARGEELAELRGATKSIDEQGVLLEWNGRDLNVGWKRLVGVVFAAKPRRTSMATVLLRDGASLAGRIVDATEAALVIRSSVFDDLTLDWSEIERIDVRSERVVFLSDVPAAREEVQPLFDKRWVVRRDTSLLGQPLRIGGQVFTKGIAMHSRSIVTYQLGGRFTQFAATVGVLDQAGRIGDATAVIFGDGRELWRRDSIRGGAPPETVLISIEGVRELGLLVDYGAELDLGDHVGWAMARLIR
jgi:hypothetical protein